MLQGFVPVSDGLGLLKLLHKVALPFFMRDGPQVGPLFQLAFLFHLGFAQLDVGLLQLVGLLALAVDAAVRQFVLVLKLFFLFDLREYELLFSSGLTHLLLSALLGPRLVYFVHKFAFLVLQVLHARHDLVLVFLCLQESELCTALRALMGKWLFQC